MQLQPLPVRTEVGRGGDPRRARRGSPPTAIAFLSALAVSSAPAVGAPPRILLTEIHYHPSPSQGDSEFLEFHNPGAEAIELDDWKLEGGVEFRFPAGMALPPGGYAILCADPDSVEAAFGGDLPIGGVYARRLSNDRERIVLRDAAGEIVWTVEYIDDVPWPVKADGAGESLQLRDTGWTCEDPANWDDAPPTPGAPIASPGTFFRIRVAGVERMPFAPGSADPIRFFAAVESEAPIASVTLWTEVEGLRNAFAMRDDGAGVDAVAGDGVHTAAIDPLPSKTLLLYWVEATDAEGHGARFPLANAATKRLGLFVYDGEIETKLPLYFLRIETAVLNDLNQNVYSDVLRPAIFIHDGEVYDGIGVRYRGAWARSWPKKSWKIVFNEDHLFGGRKRINLNSGWHDPALIREKIAYDIYRASGALHCESRMVRLELNGSFFALLVEVEQPDTRWLRRVGRDDAVLYKADSPDNQSDERKFANAGIYRTHYEKESHTSEPYDDLHAFASGLNDTSSAQIADWLERNVRIDSVVDYIAAGALTMNWDAYNKNHFVLFDRDGSGRWELAPWDLDRTLGDHWDGRFTAYDLHPLLGDRERPGVTGWSRFYERVLEVDALEERILRRIGELIETEFTEASLYPAIDEIAEAMAPEADLDRARWGGQDWRQGIKVLKQYVENRRRFLAGFVPGTPPDPPAILEPAPGATIAALPVRLVASPFSCVEPGVALRESHWQVRRADSSYRSPVIDAVTGPSEWFEIRTAALLSDTEYCFRVAYTGTNGKPSDFSEESCFTMGAIAPGPVPIDLTEAFNRDVVSDYGDATNRGFDGGTCLIPVEGHDGLTASNPAVQGLPRDGAVGLFQLGPYAEDNAVNITSASKTQIHILVPPHRFSEVRALVAGARGDCDLPAELVYADGTRIAIRIPCDDWLDDSPPTGDGGDLRPGLAPAIDGLDRICGDFVDENDGALFEVAIPTDPARYLVEILLDPARADAVWAVTGVRFNLFALIGMAVSAPAAAIRPDFHVDRDSGEAPLEVRFSNDTTEADSASFLWEFGDGSFSVERDPVHIYAEPGTYTVRLTAFGPIGPSEIVREGFITVRPGVRHFLRGEVNDDGRIDIGDAVRILEILFAGVPAPRCDDAADVNDDGGLDIGDAIRILNYLYASGPAPEPPFPDAGPDPTADGLAC
ncbi:MAG: CotH kinase family protein [Planctomycetes bacterium]|nr:CotH kinase family protein [Planctomycetota bacterium]